MVNGANLYRIMRSASYESEDSTAIVLSDDKWGAFLFGLTSYETQIVLSDLTGKDFFMRHWQAQTDRYP